MVANIAFLEVDQEIQDLCIQKNIRYTRFVDDLVFSSKEDFRASALGIIKIVTSNGFIISRKKTAYKVGPCDVTGSTVRNNMLTTTEAFEVSLDEAISATSLEGKLNYKKRVLTEGKKKR